jgi:predicted ATP-dependent endonuclease of OLD family
MHIDAVEIANFRKLKAVRIGLTSETTVLVGANNSGKTSATVAMRYFLVERERSALSLNDFTLSNWPTIDEMGKQWEAAKAAQQELPSPEWSPVLPFVDVWLSATKAEAHFVQKLIPTLDWEDGLLGVRLRLEPKGPLQLQRDYLQAREQALNLEKADKASGDKLILWPRSLTEFLQRRFSTHFTVRAFILDPAKRADPEHGVAKPQVIADNEEPIDGEPFKGLIHIDEIPAQRGFGQAQRKRDDEGEDRAVAGAAATRRMSEQLRRYWNKHLDPFENPNDKDIDALRAIESAQRAFDERLRDGFKEALGEVEGLGYPGVTDPKLKISTRLKPVDGLNHDAAVQYVVPMAGGTAIALNLPEESNGLGYQNLISMVFRLMSFRDAWMRVGKVSQDNLSDGSAPIPPLHLVLIEEPEAYLHTQVQQVFIRQAYKILRKHPQLGENKKLNTQLVLSTHSSHIAHECEFEELRYFRRLPASENAVPTSCVIHLGSVFGTDVDTKRFVTRYIRVTHCDLFFADAAVLVEGPAERILVPFFVRHHPELKSLHECYVTWLEIGGSHAHRLRKLIEHLGLTTLVVTDLDARDKAGNAVVPTRGKGLTSRNQTLATWCPEKADIDALLDLPADDKIKIYKAENFLVRSAYQCPIEVEFKGKKSEALCNTLEDALVMENLALFGSSAGTGLWGRLKAAVDSAPDVPSLSAALFNALQGGGKAEFSLNLLELKDPKTLKPPFYILDGLKWLAKQIRQRQIELNVAPPAGAGEPKA